MDVTKTKVQFLIMDDFESIDQVKDALKESEGYNELSDEEIIEKISEGGLELEEEGIDHLIEVMEDAVFIEIDEGLVLISSRLISINVDSGAGGVQEIVRNILEENDVQFEEDVTHSLEADNFEQILEIDLEDIIGKYGLEIIVSGEQANINISDDGESAEVSGDKNVLQDIKEAIENE